MKASDSFDQDASRITIDATSDIEKLKQRSSRPFDETKLGIDESSLRQTQIHRGRLVVGRLRWGLGIPRAAGKPLNLAKQEKLEHLFSRLHHFLPISSITYLSK